VLDCNAALVLVFWIQHLHGCIRSERRGMLSCHWNTCDHLHSMLVVFGSPNLDDVSGFCLVSWVVRFQDESASGFYAFAWHE
jgi:hypothetical protein